MSTVTSAYNFVPINEKVCLPAWADTVSQDIPLQGAVSGVIELTITAKTPIFVRGKCIEEHKEGDKKGHKEFEFMRHNGDFCIPGSSIKGTITNVLEILSFGKLSRINDHRFSQRDWDNSEIYDKQAFARKNKGGWLYYDEDEECYRIDYNPRSIGRITHEAIDAHYRTDFQNIFGRNFNPRETGENKSALKKYKLIEEKKRHNKTLQLKNKFSGVPEKDGLYTIDSSANDTAMGTLVFSGQPSKREFRNDKWRGKNKEFIFWESTEKGVKIDDRIMEDFLFAYYDHDPKERTTDWEHWCLVLKNKGKVPVFLQLDGKNKIKHFGLSMLYKLPFKNRIKELLPASHNDEVHHDFVETLFGYSINTKSTKGRVSFQHAYADENSETTTERTLVLSGPKASYYPFYLKQKFRNDTTTQISGTYQTYDNSATLAGRKRYPIKHIDETTNADKSAFSTTFTPLAAETTFSTKIHYHNLLPVELGALICALTFNNIRNCHHAIGMAKPYGYGAVEILVDMDTEIQQNALIAFRAYMEAWWRHHKIEGTWSESEQLQQLIAMARFSDQTSKLEYMELETFPKIKKENKALPRFTNFLNIPTLTYPGTYTKELEPFIVVEKERLLAIEKQALEKAKAIEEAQKRKEYEVILAKGLLEWLPETNDYGLIAQKMNEWIIMLNGAFITDETEVKYLLKNVSKSRNKKASKHQKTFFNEKRTNDLIRWIGKEETENFLADFK